MATIPFLAIGPNSVLGFAGLLHGPDRTIPTPAEDWRTATVDVVIPAFNEEPTIVLSLASILRQTLRPRRIILIDDGSRDRSFELAWKFCEQSGLDLVAVRRQEPIGKTPTLKRQAREFDADVLFILDADTILDSPNFIERTVQELYQGVGIASACGIVLPLRDRDRRALAETPAVQRFRAAVPDAPIYQDSTLFARILQGVTNAYRDVLYLFLQRFQYMGQMAFFGTIMNPVGCAVAYRRKYVKDLFDHYEPMLGDNLTNSEDIFLGFALLHEGYRNIQIKDVYCKSQEPECRRLPHQLYMWSSAFLQSCYYFNDLVRSPFRAIKRRRHQRDVLRKHGKAIQEKRRIQEAYRQTFGRAVTERFGRPGGWQILLGLVEKVTFPVILLALIGFQAWGALAVTVAAETALMLVILAAVAPAPRARYLLEGVLTIPVRYATALLDLATVFRFASDLWLRRTRDWRK